MTVTIVPPGDAAPAGTGPASGLEATASAGRGRTGGRRIAFVAGLALAAGAVLLPVHALATLAAPPAALLPRVVAGLWLLKALLLVTAGLLVVLPRIPLGGGSGRALVAPLPDAERAPWPRGRESAALLAVLAVALALRLRDLGDGLWFDEIQTLVDYVRLPLGRLLTTYDSQNQHMLYSLLARVSVTTFGESAWALRLPAALLGVAGIWALYELGREVASRREALLAAALLAFSYQDVWFSQNARGYTGLLLGTLVSTALFLRLLRDGRPAGWRGATAYAITMALTLFVHVTAAFVAAAHGIVWLAALLKQRRRPSDPAVWLPAAALALAGIGALVLYAPVLPQLRGTLGGETMAGVATAWKRPGWMVAELLRGLARGVPGGLVTLAAGTAVLVAGFVSYARRSLAALALMLLPALVTAAAIVAMRHNLWPRFFFAYAGFGLLVVVRGVFALATWLSARRGAALAAAVLALAALGSAWTVQNAWHPKQDYAGALAYVRAHAAPGDAVVATDMSDYVLRRYLGAGSIPVADAAGLAAVRQAHPRSWVVYAFPDRLSAVKPELWAAIQAGYAPVAEFRGTLGGGAVYVASSR